MTALGRAPVYLKMNPTVTAAWDTLGQTVVERVQMEQLDRRLKGTPQQNTVIVIHVTLGLVATPCVPVLVYVWIVCVTVGHQAGQATIVTELAVQQTVQRIALVMAAV